MYLSLNKLVIKYYCKRIVLIFYLHHVKLEESQSSCSHSFLAIFHLLVMQQILHSLSRFVLEKNAYGLLVFCNQVLSLFLVYANIPFKCFLTGLRRKSLWFLCRIISFQNQCNLYECNFNLIISDSHLYYSTMEIGTYLDQTQAVK